MSLRCTFCGKQFPELPPDALPVGKRKGATQMFRFTDGSIHNLVSTKVGGKKAVKTAEEKEV